MPEPGSNVLDHVFEARKGNTTKNERTGTLNPDEPEFLGWFSWKDSQATEVEC